LKTKQVEWLTTENGLSNNFVRAIVEDSYQHIWVSTDKGLTRIRSLTSNPSPRGEGSRMKNEGSTNSSFFILNSSFLCQPFYDGDGLEQVSFLNNAACLNRDGECMIACSKGYVRIPPQCIHYEYPREKVVFTELLYSGVAAEPGEDSPIRKSLHLERKIEMKYNHTPFSIAVSAMLPTLTQKIVYLYRLKGEGDEWLHIPHNLIHFMGMPSGKHTLEVVAMIPGGPPSEVATLDIIVKPPFWLSTWANVCYLLLLLGAGYIYVQHLKRKQRQKIAMQQMEMELRQQVEMEENKIRFFTNISHDLKTPLTLVMAPLEKTLGFDLERKVRTELEVAWRNARILYDEIVHLLDFRRLDVGAEKLNIAHGDMVSFVQRTVDSFKYYALGKNITTTLKINVASMEMDFDENKMRRIITNLLSNAHKFNKQNGSIVVSLRKVTGSQSPPSPPPTPPRGREEKPMPMLTQDEEYMELQVADTGRGISAEGKKHIFERFFQVDGDSEYIGTGIGLHIVHEYVLMHGGSIMVEDNHPEGTIFTVRIPIIRESGSAAGGETDKRQSADGKAVGGAYQDGMLQDGWGGASSDGEEVEKVPDTLLIVEDNSDVREFLQRSLEDRYRILTAANGQEAVDILEGGEENVSLMISDVMMPVMNGLQLCNFVKTNINYSHIPVILLTAKSSESDIIQGLKDGADDYITKPYSLKILELRIRKLLDWKSATLQKIAKGMDLKPSDITVSSLDAELVEKTIRVIEENMSNIDFSVVQLGKEVGLTRGHLYKKLMAITGKSPLELIRIIRLKRGHSLLEQGKSNISEVAADVGFSAKQFSKYFKEEYGCLPSEFLRKN
ncbi:MAG: response regulator, partial [Bacteroidaceae bacterium]|nr:response regulator [Bacteroidaceae bacterium]